jgi:hypothetical protein
MHHLCRFLFRTPQTVGRPVAWPLLTHGNAKTHYTHRAYTHARWGACTSTPCSGVSQTAKTAKGRVCSPVVEAHVHLRISILYFPLPPHTLRPTVLIWLRILKIRVFYSCLSTTVVGDYMNSQVGCLFREVPVITLVFCFNFKRVLMNTDQTAVNVGMACYLQTMYKQLRKRRAYEIYLGQQTMSNVILVQYQSNCWNKSTQLYLKELCWGPPSTICL